GGSLTASGNSGAVSGTVINNGAGLGWANADGSGAGTMIEANTTGGTLTFKKVQFPAPYTIIDKIDVTVTVPEIGTSFSEGDTIGCEISQSADYLIFGSQFDESANPVEGDSEYGYTIKFVPKSDGYVFPAGSADVTVTANGKEYTIDKNSFSSDSLTFSATIKTAPKQDQTITGVDNSYTVKVGDKIEINPVASGNGKISVSGTTGVIDYAQVTGTNTFEITAKKAGSATITVNAGATPFYKSASKEITITVEKADSSLTKAPAAKSLTYTGAAQALVEAGTAKNGTLQYALGTDSKTAPASGWGTTIPTGKNAGTYYVWYKVEGGDNYNGVAPACVSVKIAKATATLSKTPAQKTLTYTGKDQALVDQGTATAGTLMYAAGKDSKTAPTSGWGTAVPAGKDAGTYYVWYKVEGDDNITGIAAKCITVKIAKGQAEVSKAPAAKTGLKENGTDLALVSAGTAKNGTLKYALGKDSKTAPKSGWSTDIPTGKDFGTYYVWYKAEGDSNYSDSAAKCITVKIAEDTSKTSIKKATVAFEFKEYPYVGIPVHPNISVVLNGTQLKGKEEFTGELKDNDKVGTASLTITGVGKYKHSITKTFKIVTASVACSKTFESNVKDATDWSSSDKTIATVDSNGKITGKQAGSATITYKYKGETKTFTIQVLYKDVIKSSDFWYEPTYYLSGLGVVKGYDKQTKFKPDNDCTRAQMVTFLWRLNGSPKPKSTTTAFTDIKKSDYYYNAVLWAVEQGITTGTSKTKFGPAGVCTRAQTVTFLWRMAGKPAIGDAKNPFSDVKKGQYYYEAVIWASNQKIVAGYKDGTFKPSGKCARRQMVTFLYKYDKFVNGKG
ncbi:MAG: S-layer homology domain-containing protein, partial [Saccharofermentans sp.]|nr:S-layer homology domain-containing protein [Saccharofermentans sp.]